MLGPARRAARAGRPRPVRAAGARDRRGGGRADPRRRHTRGRDHGPARRLGDGAAPDPRRDRRRSSPRSPTRERVELDVPIGTMIELPRAALTAYRIAEAAEFFSFGTNDLTQTTWGFSRDDVEAAFFAAYLEKGVFTRVAVRDARRRRGRPAGRDRRRGGQGDPARPQARCLRRARRRPGVGALLPRRSGWTTCPARRSGCRSPGSRPAGPRSAPQASATDA